MLNRGISLLLSIVMLITMLPAPALAAEMQETEPAVVEETTVAATTATESTASEETAGETTVETTEAAVEPLAETTEEIVEETTAATEPAVEVVATYEVDNLTWVLDSDGLVTVSGTGEMTAAPAWTSSQKTAIKNVVLADGITSICDNAFQGHKYLESVTIPESVMTLGSYAFSECSVLASVTIPAGVTELPAYLFNKCYKLAGVTLPEGITTIGQRAFYNCKALTEIRIPDSVTRMDADAFCYCTALKKVYLPAGVTTFGKNVFCLCQALTDVTLEAGLTKIGEGMFSSCTSLTELVIPDSVTEIGSRAFSSCTALTSVNIPGGVTVIQGGTFSYCAALTKLALPAGVTSIGSYAFQACTTLTELTIPEGVTKIETYTFSDCSSLTVLTLPEGVTSIGSYAFSGCANLQEMAIPAGVTGIPARLFYKCDSLTKVTLPEGITAIGEYAFGYCRQLAQMEIPESVESIGDAAFYNCASLKEMTLPANVTSLGIKLFSGCSSLTSMVLPEWITTIGDGMLNGCSSLREFSIPAGVTGIYANAFAGCYRITTLELPEGLSYIGNSAFNGCGVKTLVLPASVDTLGTNAFYGAGLDWLEFTGDVPGILQTPFYNCSFTVYYPKGHAQWAATAANDGWGGSVTWVEKICVGREHVTEFVEENRVEPTCLEPGSYEMVEKCTLCGDTVSRTTMVLEPTGHTEAVLPGVPPTCDAFGTEDGVICSVCQMVLVENAPALPRHTLDESGVCILCGERAALAGGQCGENMAWRITGDNVLVFIGTGEMAEFAPGERPWEAYAVSVRAVQLTEGITLLPAGIFGDFIALTEIALPDSITAIGANAFSGCVSLTEIALPDGLTEMGEYVFDGCAALTEIRLPEGISAIPAGAFRNCAGLTVLPVSDSVTAIGDDAFAGCTGLTELPLPEGVTEIGAGAFRDCTGLTAVTLPGGLTTVEDGLFRDCTALTCVTIPEGVTSIGDAAFFQTAITTITLPESLTAIGAAAFRCCTELEKLTIPAAVAHIGDLAFADCTALWRVELLRDGPPQFGTNVFRGVDATVSYRYLGDPAWDAVISQQYGGIIRWEGTPRSAGEFVYWYIGEIDHTLHISGIAEMVDFESPEKTPWYHLRHTFDRIVVEDGIKAIGNYAFYGMSQVEEVLLPDSLKRIGDYAFYCCGMTDLSYPVGAALGQDAFYGCDKIRNFTLHGGKIPDCDELSRMGKPWVSSGATEKTIVLDSSITAIGDYAFANVSDLSRIQIMGKVETIGDYAFAGIDLAQLNLPDGLWRIGDYAFREITGMRSLVIPDTVTSMGVGVFEESELYAVELSDSCLGINQAMFKNCQKLTTVHIPEGTVSIGSEAFYGCMMLEGVSIPESVESILSYAFWGCGLLTYVTLPDSLYEIGPYAFMLNTRLESLTIPENVSEIGTFAFSGCTGLTNLFVSSTSLHIDEYAFMNCDNLTVIYFAGSSGQWDVSGSGGVRISNSYGGNDILDWCVLRCNNTLTLIRQLHLTDQAGKLGEKGAVLDGRVIDVDLDSVGFVDLEAVYQPENALNTDLEWSYTVTREEIAFLTRDGQNRATIFFLEPGDVTVKVQNRNSSDTNTYYSNAYTTVRFNVRRKVQSISIDGGNSRYGAAIGIPVPLNADIAPANASDSSITWSIVSGADCGTIDCNGVFTGTSQGYVTVRATANDGSGIYGEHSFPVEYYRVSAPEAITLQEGNSLQLSAHLTPYNATGTTICWKLVNPEDSQYLLLENDTITAMEVSEAHEVQLVAYAADKRAYNAYVTVTVTPTIEQLRIYVEGEDVTGQTILYDMNKRGQGLNNMRLVTGALPAGANSAANWSCSDTKEKYCVFWDLTDCAVIGSVSEERPGTVTLTAVSRENPKLKATVKVKFVRLAKYLDIVEPPAQLRGGSKITLKTNIGKQENLTSRAVEWSLSDESLPYASISSKGVLTTRKVVYPVTITVRVEVKDKPEIRQEIQIQLTPSATGAMITANGQVMEKGETLFVTKENPNVDISALVLPEGAMQTGSWKSSDTKQKISILTPWPDGTANVRLFEPGTVTITFTAGDGTKKSTTLKIQYVDPATAIGLTAKDGVTELRSGKSVQMLTNPIAGKPGLLPTMRKFNWSVSDPTAATVSSSGKVKALTVYENTLVTVTATAKDGSDVSESYDLLIKPAKEETLLLRIGEENVTGTKRFLHAVTGDNPVLPEETLTAWIYNSETDSYTQVDAKFTGSGKGVTVTDNGMDATVTAKAYSTATVNAKYGKLSAKVSYQTVRKVEGITITAPGDKDWLIPGKTLKLKAGVSNKDATIKSVTWAVSDEAAASISSSGVLKAKPVTAVTEVMVTAAAKDGSGVVGQFPVTIYPAAAEITIRNTADGRVMNNRTITVYRSEQESMTLEALIFPHGEGGARQDMTFSRSGKAAAITQDGVITFLKKGTVTIKVTANDGSKVTASFMIIVK